MPAAATTLALVKLGAKGQNFDGIEPNQAHVAESRCDAAGEFKLGPAIRVHGRRGIDQHADRYAWLDLKHLQKHLVEAHIRAPVDRAQIVTLMKIAMIEKLLTASGKTGAIMPADQTGERAVPADGQPLQPLQKMPVK